MMSACEFERHDLSELREKSKIPLLDMSRADALLHFILPFSQLDSIFRVTFLTAGILSQ